jgi:ankyrin repeat protein
MVVAHFTNYRVSSVPVSGTALHFAALSGNLEIAKLLVRGHWDVNKMNDDGETAFHVAAQRGELEIMKYLFEEGHVDVNLGTRENNSGSFETTALQYAARGGYLPVVKWLADNGADLDQVNVNGDSAFRIATSYKQFHVIMFLLERNAIVDSLDLETILHVAVDHGAVWVVKGVVEQQSRPANVSPAAKDHGMQEPVDRLGDVDVITWLFEQGNTDIEKAIYGRIALHMAVNNGLLLLINWVVEDQNVNINAHLDIYGTTPLHHVTRKGNVELVKWLVTQGHANVNAKDAFGQTALQLAIGMRHVELVKCLFENAKENLNVGPNASTGLWTPLHFAAFHGNLEVIRYLMKTGKVDVNAKTERHYTPAQIAAKRGHWDVVKELIEVWHARDVVKMVDIAWNPDYPDLTATVE